MGCSLSTGTKVVALTGRPDRLHSNGSIMCNRETERTPPFEKPVLTIVHFNDVYNIEERDKEPVGGAARFKTQLESLEDLKPLVLFSGDALNPSNMSTVTQGKQMIPVLNSFGVQAAVYGNHDFDFGIDHLVWVAEQTTFPWLMSNVREKATGELLAHGHEKIVLEWQGWKIGILGLVEWEWLVTLATIEPDDVEYTDFVTCARNLIPQLKNEGCDLLVALTHMRMPNDIRLAEEVPDFHLILAGHDHHYEKREVGDTVILKSGSDFRQFSEIAVAHIPNSRPSCEVTKHSITSDIPQNAEIQAVVDHYMSVVEEGMQEELGRVECDLEGRFSYIRTQETNLGNLVTDIMRKATRAEVALINSGTFRSDTVHEAGTFRVKDLTSILPMVDSLTVLEVSGDQLLLALENGVSQYPRHEGRFPQVSGLSFTFDPTRPSGRRVLSASVNGELLQDSRRYRLCTKGYVACGKDGYDILRDAVVLVNQEEGPILSSIVRNHFSACAHSRDRPDDGSKSSSWGKLDGELGQIIPEVEGRIVAITNE